MDFFERQDQARKKTKLLVFLFILAVIGIVAAVNAAVYAIYVGVMSGEEARELFTCMGPSEWMDAGYWLYVTGTTLFLIAAGSLHRYFQLRGGGSSVAELVGARHIGRSTHDQKERMLLNVVDEMAIASGMPVPELYVMDKEPGINAFVAGYKQGETVMVMTAGALALPREEIQGIIGHEFSHVFNGDMRLNVKLMGILAGILLVGQAGGGILRSLRGVRTRGKGGGQIALLIIALGVSLLIIGYIGLFFGRLIKAAISREREFLADAASVQYTRNPRSLARALKKIMDGDGSRLETSYAEEMSHLCFSSSVNVMLEGMLSTHPPLAVRIEHLDPQVLTEPAQTPVVIEPEKAEAETLQTGAAPPEYASSLSTTAAPAPEATTPEKLSASIGAPTPGHMAFAAGLLAALPPDIKAATRDRNGAKAVVYGLLLAADEGDYMKGIGLIREREGADTASMALQYRESAIKAGPAARLPVLDMCIPMLKEWLTDGRREKFLETVEMLIRLDGRTSLFEYSLHSIIKRSLGPSEEVPKQGRGVAKPIRDEAAALLCALAKAGANDGAWQGAYDKAMGRMGFAGNPAPEKDVSLASLDITLKKLAGLEMQVLRDLIEACAECVLHDGAVEVSEAELLRAISENLGCPMPPLVASAGMGQGARQHLAAASGASIQ